MKKILLLATGLLIASLVNAQQYIFGSRSDYVFGSAAQTKIGIEAGTNISNASVSSSSNFATTPVHGYHGGATFDFPVSSSANIAPEILFSQEGYNATTINGSFTQKTGFIYIPFLIKFKVNSIVNLYIGPQFSYLLSTQNTYDPGFAVLTEHYYDNNNVTNYWDGVIGISLNVIRHIDVHARYVFGLTSTPSNGDIYVPDYKTQVWQFGLGYKF